MKPVTLEPARLEFLLAGLLNHGTKCASAIVGAGFALALVGQHAGIPPAATSSGMKIATAGIGLFILLPILRVGLMLVVFVRERNYRLGVVAAIVLVVILLGMAIGVSSAPPA